MDKEDFRALRQRVETAKHAVKKETHRRVRVEQALHTAREHDRAQQVLTQRRLLGTGSMIPVEDGGAIW